MHDCPECGALCDCDGEDLLHADPDDCIHECDNLEREED